MPNGEPKFFDITTGKTVTSLKELTPFKPAPRAVARPKPTGWEAMPELVPEVIEEAPGISPLVTEARDFDIPFEVTDEKGVKHQLLIKPDNSVWLGKEQVGNFDSKTGEIIPLPMTVTAQFGKAITTAGLKAVEWFFKPFELYHEYVATPVAMGVTAPGWQKKWWEMLPEEEKRGMIAAGLEPGKLAAPSLGELVKKFFVKESEFRKVYHEWEGPKYLKGALEMVPWFFLPAIGQVGRGLVVARGLAGQLGRISPKLGQILEYSPYGLMEKVAGKIIETPIKVGGKIVARHMMVKDYQLASPKPIQELILDTNQLHPNLLRPKTFAITTKAREKLRIEKQWNEANLAADAIRNNNNSLANTEVQRLVSTVNHRFTAAEIFLLKKMPVEGYPQLPHQFVVTAPWITAKRKGASMYLRDFLEFPEDYTFSGGRLGQYAKLWVEQYHIARQAIDNLAKEHIPAKLKPFIADELTDIKRVPSRVVAQYNLKTGKELWRDEPWAGGTRGGKIAAFKKRVFTGRDSQKKAIELGYEYSDDPVRDLALYTKGVYNTISFDQQMSILKIPFELPNERVARLGKDITEGMKALEKRIKLLGGGIVKTTTKEGKVIVEKQPGVKAVIQRVLRGEVPTLGMVKAIERRFPEYGARIREALDIPVPEFEQTIRGIAKEIWAETKITPDVFRRTLDEVRRVKAGKLPLGVEPPVVGKNVTAGELTKTLDRLGVEAGKQIKFLSYLYRGTYKEATAERRTTLMQLAKDVTEEISNLRLERREVLPGFRKVREAAYHAAAAEGRILNIPGWLSVVIPAKTEWGITGRQIADEMLKRFTPEKVNAIISAASTTARVGVTLIAALDLSLMWIQGPLALGHDIARWTEGKKSNAFFQMMQGLLKGIWNPKFGDELIAKEGGLIARYAPEGLVVSKAVDYLQPEIITNAFKKWGKIGGAFSKLFGETYGRFGSGFGAGSLAGRIAIVKNAEGAFIKAGWTRRQIAEFANKITGVVDPGVLGVGATKQALLSAGLFSPNYTRAYMMVTADLFRSGLPAAEVRKAMAGMLAGGFLSYVGLCELLGQEPKLNPAPKALGGNGAEFMSIKIGNSLIGMPGFWYASIRMMASVAAAAEQEPERLLTLNVRENPFLGFWMGRTSPLVHLGREIIEQKDFMGRRLDAPGDWVDTLGSHFLTIAAQNLITRDPSEEEGKFKRFGAEIFGLRAFPQSEWDKLRDMMDTEGQKLFKKSYADLNLEQKDKVLEAKPELKQLSEQARDKTVFKMGEDIDIQLRVARQMSTAQYHTAIESVAGALVAGRIDYRTYLEAERQQRNIFLGNKRLLNYLKDVGDKESAEQMAKYLEEQAPEDKALSKYWDISPPVKDGVPDWDAFEKKRKDYLAGLDEDSRSYILRNKDRWVKDLPSMAKKLAQLQIEGRPIIEGYYDQPIGTARTAYRRANPTTDAWLLVMGRVSVPQTTQARQLALELLARLGLPPSIVPRLVAEQPVGVRPTVTPTEARRKPTSLAFYIGDKRID